MGTIYVVACLIGGGAGLFLALGAVSGRVTSLGFGLLALTWVVCTARAWALARTRNFVRHRRWMIRSFALTLAAVTLRIYLPFAIGLRLDLTFAYPAISFLCWIPNFAIAEIIVRRGSSPASAAAIPRKALSDAS
jgi:hypothetical protein